MGKTSKNVFIDGILNKPCSDCGCEITPENCAIKGFTVVGKCKQCYLNEARKRAKLRTADERKDYYIRSMHGVTLEQYNRMKADQNNLCAICGKENTTHNKSLSIDHNHNTNKIRELLCDSCNLILGHCNEDIKILEACINYLIKHTDFEKTFQHD